jgi:hypothetical protein
MKVSNANVKFAFDPEGISAKFCTELIMASLSIVVSMSRECTFPPGPYQLFRSVKYPRSLKRCSNTV